MKNFVIKQLINHIKKNPEEVIKSLKNSGLFENPVEINKKLEEVGIDHLEIKVISKKLDIDLQYSKES